jgi:hypothetical protein
VTTIQGLNKSNRWIAKRGNYMNDDSGTPKKFSDTEWLGRPAFVRVNHVFLNISEVLRSWDCSRGSSFAPFELGASSQRRPSCASEPVKDECCDGDHQEEGCRSYSFHIAHTQMRDNRPHEDKP